MFSLSEVLGLSVSLVVLVGVLLAMFLCTNMLAVCTGDYDEDG